MYVDSHAHLGSDELFPHLSVVLARAKESGVETIIDICTNTQTLERGFLAIKQSDVKVFLAAATTPHDVEKEGDLFFPFVRQVAKEGRLVAIGETGLDYYYEHSPKALQKKWLLQYFNLAKETNLPVIFHCRDAFSDLFSLSRAEYAKEKALIHCFTGTIQEAKEALDFGWYISLSGILTFKKSEMLRDVVKYIPLDRLMIETDAPYLAPQSKRGQVNESSFLRETAAQVAIIKNVTVEEVAACTKNNAKAFFSF